MDGQLFSIDTPAATATRKSASRDAESPATKPTVRRYCAARAARELTDVLMLKVRVKDVAQLGNDLIDFGAGYRLTINEREAALLNPRFQYTAQEREDIRADIDDALICELSCRTELANIPCWEELATRSTWREMADIAAQRSQESAIGRSRPAR